MKNVFELNGVRVYDLPVKELNLKPRDKKLLENHGIETAAQVQRLSVEEIDDICKKEDNKIDVRPYSRIRSCLNASEFINADTGQSYRANDNWETFVGENIGTEEDGYIGYCYMIQKREAEHVMSYEQYIAIMKKLHRDYPKLRVTELVTKLQNSNIAEQYIREMVLRELSKRSYSYKYLRDFTILFASSNIFYNVLYDMLKNHEIEEYVHLDEKEEKIANVLFSNVSIFTLPDRKDGYIYRRLSKIEFD